MRKALVSVLLLFAFSSCFSQTFSLKDTNVTSGYYRSYSIVFPLGSVIPLPECSLHLDSIVAFLVKNPSLQIEIGVHFDSRASASASSNKSKARANSIRDYFITKGIDPKRIFAQGYNDRKLLISDEEINKLKTKVEIEAAHQKNRRIEFTILAI